MFLLPHPTGVSRAITIVLLGVAMTVAGSIGAATLVVTSTADSGPGSLRAAIAAAADGDTIQFDTALNGQTITLTGGELAIDKDITISGPGPDLLTVGTSSSFRIFHVMPGHAVLMAGLTISGGNAPGSGIRNDQATLTINNCTVFGGFDNSTSGGGGIYNSGESAILTIVDTTVSNNWAFGGDGGGIYNGGGTIRVTGCIISLNSAIGLSSTGGGIFNFGMMEIQHSAISGNHANIVGGGIHNVGTLTITDSAINSNATGTTIKGSGFGGGIYNEGILVIRDSTISSNRAASLKGSTGLGGGIVSSGNGTLTISNSTISGNLANQDGGAFLTTVHSRLPIARSAITKPTGTAAASSMAKTGRWRSGIRFSRPALRARTSLTVGAPLPRSVTI